MHPSLPHAQTKRLSYASGLHVHQSITLAISLTKKDKQGAYTYTLLQLAGLHIMVLVVYGAHVVFIVY